MDLEEKNDNHNKLVGRKASILIEALNKSHDAGQLVNNSLNDTVSEDQKARVLIELIRRKGQYFKSSGDN
jgi:hypothetical protein